MDVTEDLIEKLRHRGDSYRDICIGLPVSVPTLHRFMTGHADVASFATVKAIAGALGFELVLKRVKD